MQFLKAAIDAVLGPEWIPINGHKVRLCEQLGEGGFAFVYRCEDEQGREFALKRILCQDEASVKIAEKELRILTKFGEEKNQHIIRFYGAWGSDYKGDRAVTTGGSSGVKWWSVLLFFFAFLFSKKAAPNGSEFFVLTELCKGGSLVQLLRGPIALQRGLPEHRVCALFKQICLALQVLHSHQPPVAHRDLKLENVLMTEDGTVKLCDFGSASTRCKVYSKEEMGHEEEEIQKFSTPMYRAPEMVDLYQKWEIGYKVDIWALGCILYVLAFLVHPFPDGGKLSILSGVVPEPVQLPPPSPQLSETPLALVKKLLVLKPHRRPTIQKVLELVDAWEAKLGRGRSGGKARKAEAKKAVVEAPRTEEAKTEGTSKTEEAAARAEEGAITPRAEKPARTVESPTRTVESPTRVEESPRVESKVEPKAESADDWDPFNQSNEEGDEQRREQETPAETDAVTVHVPTTQTDSQGAATGNSDAFTSFDD